MGCELDGFTVVSQINFFSRCWSDDAIIEARSHD
jgi:hypothetical protein